MSEIFLNNGRVVITPTTGLVQFEEGVAPGPVDYNIYNKEVVEQDTTDGLWNALSKQGDYYILSYADTGEVPTLKSISLDSTGGTITIIDTETHGTRQLQPSLARIDDTHFALSYRGVTNVINLKTFSMDSTGGTITQIDSLQVDSDGGISSLIAVDTTHLIMAYHGTSNYGYIKTFSIDGSYDNITEVDSLTHTTNVALEHSLSKINDTHYALAYKDNTDGDGVVKTFSIDSSADNITEIDKLIHDTDNGSNNSLIVISSTLLALSYRGLSNYGKTKTFSIDGSYDNITQVDSFALTGTETAFLFSMVKVDSTHVILHMSYSGSYLGVIKTLSFDTDGDNITLVDTLSSGILEYYQQLIESVDNQHYLLANTGVDADGFLQSIYID